MRLVNTLWQHGLSFLIFSQEMLQNFKRLTFIPKFHSLTTRCEKSCILTILGPILAILEDFLTEKEKIRQKGKSCVLSIRLGSMASVSSFSVRKCFKISKKKYFYFKVTYFRHQGWKKLYFDHFWTYFSHFGGFPIVSDDLWGHGDFFYFMTFIPKFHILATRG